MALLMFLDRGREGGYRNHSIFQGAIVPVTGHTYIISTTPRLVITHSLIASVRATGNANHIYDHKLAIM